MKRIAILGGGISGLTAAYELELARRRGAPIDWHLYEATNRLGGIVETTRHATPDGDFILEGGPDAWVSNKPSEKPWARDLAIELGLEQDLIYSNDATRRTHILMPEAGTAGKLQPIPGRMRLMVPEDLSTLEDSPLFSPAARAAYAAELTRAEELKRTAIDRPGNQHTDESVASFTLRHFGPEVLTTLAAPLLSGIFGGDVHKFSVRAVMPQFVTMEREHGSLIAALHAISSQRTQPPQPIFTSLRNGMASLIDALLAQLPPERLHLNTTAHQIACEEGEWTVWLAKTDEVHRPGFQAAGSLSARPPMKTTPSGVVDMILLATSLDETRRLLLELDPVPTAFLPSSSSSAPSFLPSSSNSAPSFPPSSSSAPSLLPTHASSAVLATFCWTPQAARTFTVPPGFGFLVAQQSPSSGPSASDSEGHDFSRAETACKGTGASAPEVRLAGLAHSGANVQSAEPQLLTAEPQLLAESHPRILACTFVDQKFPHRCPPGARILRVFFGGPTADTLAQQPDETIASTALTQLQTILGPLPPPDPALTTIRRWPRSLPQYEVGHLDRMAQLDTLIAKIPGLTLLGNSYRGVGLPDLIHAARIAARSLEPVQKLGTEPPTPK